jgi:hypothetical protein
MAAQLTALSFEALFSNQVKGELRPLLEAIAALEQLTHHPKNDAQGQQVLGQQVLRQQAVELANTLRSHRPALVDTLPEHLAANSP